MSSPDARRGRVNTARKVGTRGKAAATSHRTAKPAAAKSGGAKRAAKPKTIGNTSRDASAASAQAIELAAAIERGLAERHEALSLPAMQELIAALCKDYSARIESGQAVLPIRGRTVVSSTDIMTTASGLLKAANLAVFELGMWQSWTGR